MTTPYAVEMEAKYGPITTWAALMRAARAEGWPMPLAEMRIAAYRAATPQQRLAAVRRSTRLALETHMVRWPVVDHPSWSPTPTVGAIRQRLLDWAEVGGLAVDWSDSEAEFDAISAIKRDAWHARIVVSARGMPRGADAGGPVGVAYAKALWSPDSVAAYTAIGAHDTAAAEALYAVAEAAASSVWSDAPLVGYLAEHGELESRPVRGSEGEAARRASETGARAAATAAGAVGRVADSEAAKAEADWESIEYIAGVLDGAGRAAGSP